MTSGARRSLLTGGTIAVVAGLLVIAWAERDRFALPAPGGPAPAYAAMELGGGTLELAELRGKVVLLNVWATWCAPCVREMPALQRLYERLAPEGLEVIAVSVDPPFDLENGHVQQFVNDLGLTFRILHDATGRIERSFGITGYPTTIVIDREGSIRWKEMGERPWDEPDWADRIEKLLRG